MAGYSLERSHAARGLRFCRGVKDAVIYEVNADRINTGVSWAVKVKLQSVASSDLAANAAVLGLSPDDTLASIENRDLTDPKPKSGFAIVIDGARWIIGQVIDYQTRQWRCVIATAGSRERIDQMA